MAKETEIVFPRALSDLYPPQAQALYVETYKRSMATSVAASADSMSREGVASRDAWEAVSRAYLQDPVTHKFRPIGDQATTETTHDGKRSLLDTIKDLFKR